jgi:2,4-dienoyl-CoA reductase-like NADH-dependent reductase (Old Yellow Enzyme family)
LWTIAVGLITKPHQADDIIVQGKADMVSLGRGMLYDPRWPWHAAVQLEHKHSVAVPKQYERAWPLAAGQPISASQAAKREAHSKD